MIMLCNLSETSHHAYNYSTMKSSRLGKGNLKGKWNHFRPYFGKQSPCEHGIFPKDMAVHVY